MKYKFFMIPACDAEKRESELNRFLAANRIAGVEKEFVCVGAESFWSFCITYSESSRGSSMIKKTSVDYKEVLGEREFALFAQLRTLRKEVAQEEGIPAYALFTNEQLARLVTEKVVTLSAMEKIQGIGKKRVEKYGERFIQVLKKGIDKKPEQKGKESDETEVY
jgi:superfamily II DNA helicase RecQ